MPGLKRIYNIFRYGVGKGGKQRKQAAKVAARQEKFESDRWQKGDEMVQRKYGSYEEYVSHQGAKLDKIIHRLRETEEEDFADFKRRFETCDALSGARSVLCLGARIGTEVRAMHAVGLFAVGIDLNPGKDNAYVLPGDFHHIQFPDGSVDAIYTNVLDHVFDLDKMLGEVVRLLKPGGVFVTDMIAGFEEGFVPGEYEAMHWKDTESLSQKIVDISGFTRESGRDLGFSRRDQWYQVVFRKQ